jgi:hypothetical protein
MHLNLSLTELKKIYDDAFEQGVHEGSIRATGECREEYFRRTFPTNEHSAAVETLKRLGYTYKGGERWKPPLGTPRPPRDEFQTAYWKACGSSDPRDWMSAALAAQRVLKTPIPACAKEALRDAIEALADPNHPATVAARAYYTPPEKAQP